MLNIIQSEVNSIVPKMQDFFVPSDEAHHIEFLKDEFVKHYNYNGSVMSVWIAISQLYKHLQDTKHGFYKIKIKN